jgi:NTP pyrophosphatase (non-canonical NTP hydrolase)
MKKVHDKILDWAEQRGLLYGPDIQPEKQMLKLVEEVGETAKALAYGDEHGLKDGIGDCVVCLIVLAEQKGLTLKQCMEAAYKEISQSYRSIGRRIMEERRGLIVPSTTALLRGTLRHTCISY